MQRHTIFSIGAAISFLPRRSHYERQNTKIFSVNTRDGLQQRRCSSRKRAAFPAPDVRKLSEAEILRFTLAHDDATVGFSRDDAIPALFARISLCHFHLFSHARRA